MTDRELLELAAKAIGFESDGESYGQEVWFDKNRGRIHGHWNPLEDDGDAFKLAVRLSFCIYQWPYRCQVTISRHDDEHDLWTNCHLDDKDQESRVRRAIVCAAAEIGKSMP